MTNLEVILITCLWIGYGVWCIDHTKWPKGDKAREGSLKFVFILISPVLFIIKALYGAFIHYE